MSVLSGSPLLASNNAPSARVSPTFSSLIAPLERQLPYLPPVVSGSNRPLTYTFAHQVRALVYYHTETFASGQALLQAAQEDPLARQLMVPDGGLGTSTFYEANATRGGHALVTLFHRLAKKVSKRLRVEYPDLGPLRAIDGSLIEASLSMTWASYSSTCRKAKVHVGFNLNQGLPWKVTLTDGQEAERPFVSTFLESGETGVMDRGYLDYRRFDDWINEGKHFVVRLRAKVRYEILERREVPSGTPIFFFAKVRLGDPAHPMSHPLFLVGFQARGTVYWIVTDRADLSAQQIAFIFSLRWAIETFFAWWKRHLKVYHLLSRDYHGVFLQLLAGLITYLLLVLYFHHHYGERPSLARLRSLRQQIRQEIHTAVVAVYLPVYLPVYIIDIELILCLWGVLQATQAQAKS